VGAGRTRHSLIIVSELSQARKGTGALRDRSPLPTALVCRACDAWLSGSGINPSANFLSYSEGQPGVGLARLICTRCRKDVKSVLRCRSCGTLYPTSKIGAAMLSPSAFAFYGLISIVVAIFWFD
jgi:hypothetical protein